MEAKRSSQDDSVMLLRFQQDEIYELMRLIQFPCWKFETKVVEKFREKLFNEIQLASNDHRVGNLIFNDEIPF